MSLTITSIIAVVVSGLLMAMQTAWQHTDGLQTANSQARVALQRIEYLISQAGVYQLAGQPTQVGLAVVPRSVSGYNQPENLVIWCGGRFGGLAAAGVQNRLPLVSELVIYAPDPADPSRLVEINVSSNMSPIDFRDAGFANTIQALVNGSQAADRALICNGVRTTNLNGSSRVGCVRFDLFEVPSASDLNGVTPGTDAWNSLTWAQGIVTSDSGLRQAQVRIELQLESRPDLPASNTPSATTIPFFGSASHRYVYLP
jgi:hypothetical protein